MLPLCGGLIPITLFSSVDFPTPLRPNTLSGGQQQQLSIARALIQEPTLLLLDEPTEGLQPSVVEEIDDIIKRIRSEKNCSILLVEQNLEFVRAVTQHFAIMDSGRIVEEGEIDMLTDELAGQYLTV